MERDGGMEKLGLTLRHPTPLNEWESTDGDKHLIPAELIDVKGDTGHAEVWIKQGDTKVYAGTDTSADTKPAGNSSGVNLPAIIGGIVVLALVAGGGIWLSRRSKQSQNSQSTPENEK